MLTGLGGAGAEQILMPFDAIWQLSRSLTSLILAAVALSGVGSWLVRFLGAAALPVYWTFPLSLVLGEAALSLTVQAMLFAGVDTRVSLPEIGIAAVVVGAAGWLTQMRSWRGTARRRLGTGEYFLLVLIALSLFANFSISAAPSTKIDELYYHMLLPKRIVEDGGLRFYLLPLEQAILPQMHYQLLLSVGHALHLPDLGNVASFTFSIGLLLALAGACYGVTENVGYALLVACTAVAGLYTSVWHTTSGAHALGDLSTFLAGVALLKPLVDRIGAFRYVTLVSTLCCISASTKLSLWPMAALGTALGILVAASSEHGRSMRQIWLVVGGVAPWLLIHLPLLLWTFRATGSPWGPVAAGWFGPTIFPPDILEQLKSIRTSNQTGLSVAVLSLFPRLSPLFLMAVAYLILKVRTCGTAQRGLLLVFAGQVVCIAMFFPHDFRFLGGLQFVLLFAAAIQFLHGKHAAGLLRHIPVFAALLIAPWVALQWYYGLPFLRLMSGSLSREAFLSRYVAFHQDFRKLDGLLPRDCVLYSPVERIPSLYVPRPVIFTMLDWDHKRAVYLFDFSSPSEVAGGSCPEVVYHNENALTNAFRTPGRRSEIGPVVVRRCITDQ